MPNPIALTQGRLSPDQIEGYWEDGFIFPVTVFDSSEAARLRAEFEEIEQNWREADLPLPLTIYKRVNAHVVMPLVARIALL